MRITTSGIIQIPHPIFIPQELSCIIISIFIYVNWLKLLGIWGANNNTIRLLSTILFTFLLNHSLKFSYVHHIHP
jgi:hypothetical protein